MQRDAIAGLTVVLGAKAPRFQMASAAAPSAAPAVSEKASAGDSFFTHICGARVMADVTITPGHSGPVEVLVKLEDGDERPLGVDALSVTLSNPDKNIAPVAAAAEWVAADQWRVRMTAASNGKWLLSLGIDMKQDDRIDIAAPILIE